MNYSDIINIKEYRSAESLKAHPRMDRAERAKIFSPFAALRGYEESIGEEERKSKRVKRPYIAEVKRSKINETLKSLNKHDIITLSYFSPETEDEGEVKILTSEFIKLNEENHTITLKAKTIKLKYLLKLETTDSPISR